MIVKSNVTKKIALLLCLISSLGVTLPANARKVAPMPPMPAPLIGVWYPDNADGRERCVAMKKKEHMEGNIALALEITASEYKQLAEYGEGNFMSPYRIVKNAKNVWTAYTHVSIEGDDVPSGKDVTRFALKGSKITLTEFFDDGPRVTKYTKCMATMPSFDS